VTLILHDVELDEDSYKVRLLLGYLGLEHRRVPAGAPGAAESIEADLPCLRDGDLRVRGAEAILAYLARRYDWRDRWLPADEPVLFGETLTWLSFASRRLRGVGLVDPIFGIVADDPDEVHAARVAFRMLDEHLTVRGRAGGSWFVGRQPTVADVAIFPAVAMSAAAGMDLGPYPALQSWLGAMHLLPGFVAPPSSPANAGEVRQGAPRRLSRQLRGSNVIALPAPQQRPTNSAA
jgi:glutathione S-transferase